MIKTVIWKKFRIQSSQEMQIFTDVFGSALTSLPTISPRINQIFSFLINRSIYPTFLLMARRYVKSQTFDWDPWMARCPQPLWIENRLQEAQLQCAFRHFLYVSGICLALEKRRIFLAKNISSEGSTGKSLQNPQSQRNLRTPGQGIRLEILKPRTGRKSSWDVADILTVKLLGQRQGVCLLLTWLWQANRLLGVRPGKWSMKFLSLSADTVTEERKGLRTISGLIKYA